MEAECKRGRESVTQLQCSQLHYLDPSNTLIICPQLPEPTPASALGVVDVSVSRLDSASTLPKVLRLTTLLGMIWLCGEVAACN